MTKEEKYVVNPLIKWFKSQQASWQLYKPSYGTAATGWDIEARRKNQDLLIEAKYIRGPFLHTFSALVAAPLAKRPQHFMLSKYRSWSYGICWAIGAGYKTRNIYQILFDYYARNPKFWHSYGKLVRMKYIFFVEQGKVKRVPWSRFLLLAKKYTKLVDEDTMLSKRRSTAEHLMRYKYN